jgi:lysophospholipase L1-like esterase
MLRYIIALIVLAGCSKKQTGTGSVLQPVPNTTKTYLALGDSYTIGQGVAAADRFPAQTDAWLRQRGINLDAVNYIATTGWPTTALQTAINLQNPAPHTVVSLLIGVNDQYINRDTSGYRQRFTVLLQKSIELAKGKKENVVVLSIPDYSVTPYAAGTGDTARIRLEIDWFNAINRSVTVNYNVAYLDITPSTREARNNPALIATDGLHPSGLEYRKWAERLGPIFELMLR